MRSANKTVPLFLKLPISRTGSRGLGGEGPEVLGTSSGSIAASAIQFESGYRHEDVREKRETSVAREMLHVFKISVGAPVMYSL